MKILSIGRPTDALKALPPAALLQLAEASIAVMQQQHKEGKLLEYYYSPAGGGRIIIILDYRDGEEWVKDLMSVPIQSYYEYDIYPMADGFETAKAMFAAMKAAGV